MLLIWVALFPGFLVTYYLLPEFVRLNRFAVWLSAAGSILIMYAGIYYLAFVETGSVAWSWYEDKRSLFIYSLLVLLVFVGFGTLGPTQSYNSRTLGNIWGWTFGEKPYTPRFALQVPHAAITDVTEADAQNIVEEPAPPAQEELEPASPRRITNIGDVNTINTDNLKKNLEGIVGGSFAVHPDDLIGRLKQIGVIPDKPINTIGGMVGYKPNVNITIFGFPVMEIWSPDLVKKSSGDSTTYSLLFSIPSEWSPEEVKQKLVGNSVILFGNQNYTAEVGDWHGRTVIHAGHDWHNYLSATYTYLPESSKGDPGSGKIVRHGGAEIEPYSEINPYKPDSKEDSTRLNGNKIKDNVYLRVSGDKVDIVDNNGDVLRTIINEGNVASAEFIENNKIIIKSELGGNPWIYQWNDRRNDRRGAVAGGNNNTGEWVPVTGITGDWVSCDLSNRCRDGFECRGNICQRYKK